MLADDYRLNDFAPRVKHGARMDGVEMDSILRQIGWTREELQRRLGVRADTIRGWLSNRRPIPENVADWLRIWRDLADQAPGLPEGWHGRL